MSKLSFRTAKRKQVMLRVFLLALSGHGKTYTLLALAMHLAKLMGLPPEAVGIIDSEVTAEDADEGQGSAEKYEGERCRCEQCQGQGIVFEGFKTLLLPPTMRTPDDYTAAVAAAKSEGVKILGVDSMSHEWESALELVDQIKKQSNRNQFTAWGDVTPMHDRFVRRLQSYPGHVICTIRGKEKHEQYQEGGKNKVRSLGILPVQRTGIEYEFDVGMFLDNGCGSIVKSRAAELNLRPFDRPGERLAADLLNWSQRGNAQREREQAKAKEAEAFQSMDTRELRTQIEGLLRAADPALRDKIQGLLTKAGGDPEKLGKLLAWARQRIDSAEERALEERDQRVEQQVRNIRAAGLEREPDPEGYTDGPADEDMEPSEAWANTDFGGFEPPA